jgi:flagellin-like protein
MAAMRALSPLIGTILMVMISLMLGAILGTFAFGMTESMHTTRIIATSVVQSGPDILITYRGGAALDDLYSIAVIAPGGMRFYTVSPEGALSQTGTPVAPCVGSVMVLSGAATADQDHVVVIAHFTDGNNQILSDVFV